MPTPPPHRICAAHRSGFSIVEVIVAMMIVTIGLLGIAGASTIALRTTLDVARRRDAVERAQSRIALIAAGRCAQASNGTASDAARRLTEQWTVAQVGAFRQVTDSVTWDGARGVHSITLTSAIPC